jgi:hypothetical protein
VGQDHGRFYEGVKWTLTKTRNDAISFPGTAEITDWDLGRPSANFRAAVARFAEKTGFNMEGRPW